VESPLAHPRIIRAMLLLAATAVAFAGCTRDDVALETAETETAAGTEEEPIPDLPAPPDLTASDASDPQPVAVGEPTLVGTEGAVVDLGEAVVTVPAGAVPTGQSITVWEAELRGGLPLDGEQFGPPVIIELDSVSLVSPIEVRWSLEQVEEPLRRTVLPVRWDRARGAWATDTAAVTAADGDGPHDTTVEVRDDQLVLSTTSFSARTWFVRVGQTALEIIGTRVDAPACDDGPLPAWVRGVVRPDADLTAAPLRTCTEPDTDDAVTLRVAGNRTFSQRLHHAEGGQEYAWRWPGVEPPGDLHTALYRLAHEKLFAGDDELLVPPRATVAVGVGRPTSGANVFVRLEGEVSGVTILTDIVIYAVERLSIAGFDDDRFLGQAITALYECGGSQLLAAGVTAGELDATVARVLDVLATCSTELMRPESAFGRALENAVSARQMSWEVHRSIHSLHRYVAGLRAAEIAFYTGDVGTHLAAELDASVGFRLVGRPGELGSWQPTCTDPAADSTRLYRNIALQDVFLDASRELWEFDEWRPAARKAVEPLSVCEGSQLLRLADLLPEDWGDPRAARVVAEEVRGLLMDVQALVDVPPRPGCETFHLSFVREGELDSPSAMVLVGRDPSAGTGQAHPSVTEGVRVVTPLGSANGPKGMALLAQWAATTADGTPLLWVCGHPNAIDLVVGAGQGAPAPSMPSGEPVPIDTIAIPGVTIDLPDDLWTVQPRTDPLGWQALRDDTFYTSVQVRVLPGRSLASVQDDVRTGYLADWDVAYPEEEFVPVEVAGAQRAVRFWAPSGSGDLAIETVAAQVTDHLVVEVLFATYIEDLAVVGEEEVDDALGSLRFDASSLQQAIGW
jgi:hypothetical protein